MAQAFNVLLFTVTSGTIILAVVLLALALLDWLRRWLR
jgi:hypothetical protein